MNNGQTSTGQIPLPFSRYDQFDFVQYWPGENQSVIDHLQQLVAGQTDKSTFLWGETGSGKSHLLQAVCSLAAENKRVAYIPLKQCESLIQFLKRQKENFNSRLG